MRHKKLIVLLGICLIVGVIGAYFAYMPYPVRLWWAFRTHGPIIDPDIDTHLASTLLKNISQERKMYELVESVKLVSPTHIRITTLQWYRGLLAQGGQMFEFTYINGKWTRTSATRWIS